MSMTIKFRRTLHKSGGSIVVSIPLELLEAYSLKDGDRLDIYSKNGGIVLEKAGEL